MAKKRKKVEIPDNLRGVLARNLFTIMEGSPAFSSQPKVAQKSRIAQTSIGRFTRAEVAATLDNVEALARALNLEPWQLLVPDLDPTKPPKLGRGEVDIPADERELLASYRRASARWKVSLRYMAALRADDAQEEVAEGINVLLAAISARPVPDERLGPAWTRPDRRAAVHEPKAKYEKDKKP